MNYYVLTFAEARQPEYKERKRLGYVEYGLKNDYPNYLVELFDKSAKHNAIIKNKVNYICGNGWTGGSEEFVNKVNRVESLADLSKKVSTDIELFGGAYIEVIWNSSGQVAELWHIDYTKIRTNKDNTQYWYKDDWMNVREETIIYPGFNPKTPEGSQIYYTKEYRPNNNTYSLPSYFGALNYIESDIEVSKHVLGNAKTGFSASKLITLTDGNVTEEEQKTIFKQFQKTYTGSDGVKFMLSFVNDAARKPIVDSLGESDLTREDFSRVDELIQTNIFSGHQITTPSIFGIAVAGKLGTRTEMRDGYEIFRNTYVNGKQIFLESLFNMFAGYGGYSQDLKIIPTEPIGIEFSENILSQIMTKNEMREKIGLKILEEQTNPPIQMSLFDDEYNLFYEFGEDKGEFEIIKERQIFENEKDVFADINKIQSNILDLISKDKLITPEVISKTIREDIDVVKKVLKQLEERGYIEISEKSYGDGLNKTISTERKLTKPLSKIIEDIKPVTTELLIRYSYDWKRGYSNADIETSRPFCKYLLGAKKFYSRSDIEQMSARLGYSVWDRRGGWWTMPNGKHSTSCRHVWKQNVVKRK
jgi:DNA-binding MarR family transcriptional regulator